MPFWDAVCSTWFCKFEAGEDGRIFGRVLRKYLENLEKILSRYVLLMLGFNLAKPVFYANDNTSLTLQELDNLPPTDALYEELWGSWVGSSIRRLTT